VVALAGGTSYGGRMNRVCVPLAIAALGVAGCGSSDSDPPASTTQPPQSQTQAQQAPRATSTTTTATPARETPEAVARKFAAAYQQQDWDEVCALYSDDAIDSLKAGAKQAGVGGTTCAEILRATLGQGLELEPLDVSGEATIDGDTAKVGEVTLRLVDGRWRVEDR
jgi:hypothetical protein